MVDCAIILAGGFGTRLRSVVNDRPKVMATVGGRPFITRLLDQLAAFGIKKVVLCTGYMASSIRESLGDRYCDMDILYSVEEVPLGTGGALRQAIESLSGDLFLVMNGDSYCACNLSGFIAEQSASGTSAGIVLVHVDDVARFGAVRINSSKLVSTFTEKGEHSGPGLINAGIYLLPKPLIQGIPSGRPVSLEREIFPTLVTNGLYGYCCPGPFIDIGVPIEYERAQSLFSGNMEENQ